MVRSSSVGVAGALIVSAFLFVCGLAALAIEADGQRSGSGSDADFFEMMAGPATDLPLSLRATERLLSRCVTVVGGFYGFVQPPTTSASAREGCLSLAREAVEAFPTYAFGSYALAQFLFARGEAGPANAALARSQDVGAHEQWVAELRVNLAEDQFERLSSEVLAGHERDLRLLALSGRGVRAIAARYIGNVAFRERITAIVETLPQENQRRFVSHVNSYAQQM